MASYPTLSGMTPDGVRTNVLGWEEPIYKFVREDGTLRSLYDVGVHPFYEQLGVSSSRVVRPKVGAELRDPLSEAVTLWALLFCLSELALYYPDIWVGALDPDTSVAAVTLEHGLDVMLNRAPALIASALGGPIDALIWEELRQGRLPEGMPDGEPGEE